MPKIILAARGRITTHFGEDIGRGFPHRGIDQGHGDGEPVDLEIRAPAAGKVIAVGRDGSYGLRIIILHDDFTVSLLAHHARQFVSVGDRVEQWQLIAEMGNTGTVYVHNHQEYRDKFGNQLDPLLHLVTAASASEGFTPLATVAAVIEPEENTLKVYANIEVAQGWVIGGAGTWREIPDGYADAAISAFGPVVKLSNVAFDFARKICRNEPYGG